MPYYAKNNGVWVQGGKHLIKSNGAYVASDGYAKNNGVWSKYTSYTWERWSVTTTYVWDVYDVAPNYIQVPDGRLGLYNAATSWGGNSYTLNPDNGLFTIQNASQMETWQAIGRYFFYYSLPEPSSNVIFYVTNSADGAYYYADKYISQNVFKQGASRNTTVSSSNSTAYPVNGYQGGYWYVRNESKTIFNKGTTQYADVTDSNPNAYPVNGYQGGYWYVRK